MEPDLALTVKSGSCIGGPVQTPARLRLKLRHYLPKR